MGFSTTGNPQRALKNTAAEEIWLRVPCDLWFWLRAEVGDRPARRAALGMSVRGAWRLTRCCWCKMVLRTRGRSWAEQKIKNMKSIEIQSFWDHHFGDKDGQVLGYPPFLCKANFSKSFWGIAFWKDVAEVLDMWQTDLQTFRGDTSSVLDNT